MANFNIVAQQHPQFELYLRPQLHKKMGDRVVYRPLIQTKFFQTDARGVRRTYFGDDYVSFSRASTAGPFDLLLGSSQVFGSGLADDKETLASQLALNSGRLAFGAAMPEAATAELLRVLQEFGHPTETKNVFLFPIGSFTRFTITGLANPIDGPPALSRPNLDELRKKGLEANTEDMFDYLVRYQLKSIRKIAETCELSRIPFFLVSERTFFDKTTATDYEKAAELGTPGDEHQARRFELMRTYSARHREAVFDALKAEGVKVIDYPPADELSFIDEFHLDAPSTARVGALLAQHAVGEGH